MAKYWYNCKDCNKRIKKLPDFSGTPLCCKCVTNRRIKTLICKKCNIEFTFIDIKNRDRKYCSRYCANIDLHLGKINSDITKKKMSENASIGSGRCNWYDIWCPYLNKNIKIQGRWELEYAKYLNDNNISWKRDETINLNYRLHKNDIERIYHPDFLLIESLTYIEIKGAWLGSSREKMDCVIKQNSSKNIKILESKQLETLGINLRFKENVSHYGEKLQYITV